LASKLFVCLHLHFFNAPHFSTRKSNKVAQFVVASRSSSRNTITPGSPSNEPGATTLILHTAIFAQAATHLADGWTNKEVLLYMLTAVGGTVTVVVPVAWGLLKILTRNSERRAAKLEAENRSLRRTIGDFGDAAPAAELRQHVDESRKTIGHLEETLTQVRVQAEGFEKAVAGLEGERNELSTQLAEAKELLTAEQKRISLAVKKDGVTWTEKVRHNAPEFKPLDPTDRRTPVISLLNLKGGVGKTTATANLGAAFARLGWRVLLIDLDLQGSLTSLFLTDSEQDSLHGKRKLAGDFLEASFDGHFPNLPGDFAVPVLPGTTCSLVPTTDEMAYAETNLTVRWFLKDSKRDPRFLLRKELQLKRVTNEYDIVLLDCPPFINISCVNALAASDYVLVPVLPSRPVTDRVTILMERIKEFHDNLNSDLKVLGFFANRTRESSLTNDERNRLSALRDKCKDTWAAAPCFDAFIRQSVEIRNAEDERRPIGPGDDLCGAFVRLAHEVESRLPMFCRPARVAERREAVS
jgi:cellulose biosynthesis protein BcsQ